MSLKTFLIKVFFLCEKHLQKSSPKICPNELENQKIENLKWIIIILKKEINVQFDDYLKK